MRTTEVADAIVDYKAATVVARQLLHQLLSARELHGDGWESHVGGEVWVADPVDIVLAVASQLDAAGAELVACVWRSGHTDAEPGTVPE